MEIIQTRYKEKIPKGFSYPIGAEKISAVLADSLLEDDSEISFWVKDEYWASSYNRRIKNEEPIKIFQLEYYSPTTHLSSSKSMLDSGFYDPKWRINVYAIPTKSVSLAKQLLISELDEAAKWLLQPNAKKQVWKRYYDIKNCKLIPTT